MNVSWFTLKAFPTFVLGLFFSLFISTVSAQNADPYKEGPVHEAYVTPSTANGVVIQGIAAQPPPPIDEQKPPQCHRDAIWIPGYWAFVNDLNDFVWVSGVWRKAPPDHIWIPGFWKQFGNNWAWIRGFWSQVSEKDLDYINETPPDEKREEIPESPGENYFWLPGYWDYDKSARKYNWLSGQWIELSADWVYVPAYYLWRPGGYLFIPGYWDYPLDQRGCAYAAVRIEPQYRSTISYTPTVILDDTIIITWLFGYYPNYSTFFWHHWHFHPGFWGDWCCIPPWWWWDACWCFGWVDSWWLWWWWMTPGFPAPPWLLAAMAQGFPPPIPLMLDMVNNVVPPPIMAPWGMIPPAQLIDAIPGNEPIMPADPEEADNIIDSLKPPGMVDIDSFRPTGDPEDTQPLPRPEMEEVPETGGGTVTPPPPPSRPLPPITRPPQSTVPRPSEPPIVPWVPPTYQPLPQPPHNVLPPHPVPRPRPSPRPRPDYRPPSYPPSYQPPSYHPPRPSRPDTNHTHPPTGEFTPRPPQTIPRPWTRPQFTPPHRETTPPSWHPPSGGSEIPQTQPPTNQQTRPPMIYQPQQRGTIQWQGPRRSGTQTFQPRTPTHQQQRQTQPQQGEQTPRSIVY